MDPVSLEKVIERMAIGDDVILTVKRDLDGKMRATAKTWADAKVIGRHEVIEIRNVDGQCIPGALYTRHQSAHHSARIPRAFARPHPAAQE